MPPPCPLTVVRTVVATASVTTIVTAAIMPTVAAIIVAAIMPTLGAIVIDTVVPYVIAHLMLALLMVGRIIAAAARLSDGRYRDGTGEGEHGQAFGVAGMHLGIPPRVVAM